jgi:hypothetical protein
MIGKLKRLIVWLIIQIGQAMPVAPRPAGMRREIVVDGVAIIAFEITVAEMRSWLVAARQAVEFDVLGATLFKQHEVTVDDLVLMTTASRAFIEGATGSELVKLVEAVKETNPFFFQFRQDLKALASGNP